MKIRQGFVSNSSSSNFIVFGKSVTFESIKINNLRNIFVTGDDLDNGTDVFSLTEDIYTYIIKHKNSIQLDRLHFMWGEFGEDSIRIRMEDLLEEGKRDDIYYAEYYYSDYNSTDGLDAFIDRYTIKEEEDETQYP